MPASPSSTGAPLRRGELATRPPVDTVILLSMKKALFWILGVLLALVLVVYVGGQFFLGSAVKAGVNRVGPRLTQSEVELASASLSPLSGSGTLSGLTVGNPAGWSSSHALYVGSIHFEVEPSSLLHDPVVIRDLTVQQPEFTYETRVLSSNIGDLLKNIEHAVGGTAPAAPGAPHAPRRFVVHHFRLEQGKVTVGVGPAAIPLVLPPIELKELGVAEGGLTSGQLAFAVVREIAPNIVAATTDATGKLGGTMGAAASDALRRAGENLQKWIGGGKK
jgi:hypothetical protein